MITFKKYLDEKRDYKTEYKKFQSSPERIKYRSELNKYNREKGTYGNGDKKDASHKNGKIVGISSVVALSGNPGQANYVSSKSGMIGFYKSLAHEVASRNINVNVVSPGFIVSPMTQKLNEIQKNKILDNIPMKKFGEPADVANLVYFLTSNEASYITGQNFHVNGGMLMD